MIKYFSTLLLSYSVTALIAQTGIENPLADRHRFAAIKVILRGTIRDAETRMPLPGATVYLADDKIGAIADAEGQYLLANIPVGHHVVEVSHTGYSTLVAHMELVADMEKDFILSPVILENQGVIVTGVAGATSIRKAPVSVASLKKHTLLQIPSSNIVDALTHIPGVAQLSTGPAISKPFIRGLGYNRVVTVHDGVRQEGQQWGDEHGIEIDEMSITRVEVLKGPASLIYGSDALAGVTHFMTSTPVAEGTLKANLLTSYQSNSGLSGVHANIAGNKDGLNWNAYGTYKTAGDYQNKYDGRVLNSRFNEKNFGGYAGINKSWGFSHFIISHFNQNVGMVEGDREVATGRFILFAGSALERTATDEDLASRKLFVPNQNIRHTKFVSDHNFAIGQSRLKINLAYQKNIRREFGDPENPGKAELFFDLQSLNYSVQWHLPEIKEWHTTIGVSGMRQINKNRAEELLIPEYHLFDAGGFVYTQRFFSKSTLSGGLRFDYRLVDTDGYIDGSEVKFTALRKFFSNFSGSIGFSAEPTDQVTLKANLARGFRAPSIAELSSNGAHEGTNRYEYGEQSLKSETSLQVDAGIDFNYEHFSMGISAFYNRMNDFIFYRKLASVYGGDSLVHVDGEEITAFRFNQHDATLAGLEASLDIHPHPLDWLHIKHSIAFVRGKFEATIDGSDRLPLIPAARLTGELKGEFRKAGKSFRNLYLKLEAEKTFAQKNPFTGFDTESATAGYFLLHAGAGSDVSNKKDKIIFSIHLGVSNITDVAWQNHLSRLKYAAKNMASGRTGIFNAGRNFSVKVNVPFSFRLKQ